MGLLTSEAEGAGGSEGRGRVIDLRQLVLTYLRAKAAAESWRAARDRGESITDWTPLHDAEAEERAALEALRRAVGVDATMGERMAS